MNRKESLTRSLTYRQSTSPSSLSPILMVTVATAVVLLLALTLAVVPALVLVLAVAVAVAVVAAAALFLPAFRRFGGGSHVTSTPSTPTSV